MILIISKRGKTRLYDYRRQTQVANSTGKQGNTLKVKAVGNEVGSCDQQGIFRDLLAFQQCPSFLSGDGYTSHGYQLTSKIKSAFLLKSFNGTSSRESSHTPKRGRGASLVSPTSYLAVMLINWKGIPTFKGRDGDCPGSPLYPVSIWVKHIVSAQ